MCQVKKKKTKEKLILIWEPEVLRVISQGKKKHQHRIEHLKINKKVLQ